MVLPDGDLRQLRDDGERRAEPLTCSAFLTDYAPGRSGSSRRAPSPVIRDLVVEVGDFMRKLPTVKRG